jgi:ABC-type amino acid transport substrate-binding protein
MGVVARIGIPARWRSLVPYVFIFAPLAAVYLLPPDTSLAEVRRAGILRACVPSLYPPLVTGDPAAPGIDMELVRAVAADLGVRADFTVEEAMGRDFNPRSWHVTRAQCEMLAGGIVASPATKSFLETSTSYAQTGWAFLLPNPIDLAGRRAGVFAGASGLDRIALARFLRERTVMVTIVPRADLLEAGLRDGRFEFGVTERLIAEQIAGHEGFRIEWVPDLPRYPLALGLWKGDLTLKRAVVDALARLERSGEMAAIMARYLRGPAAAPRAGSVLRDPADAFEKGALRYAASPCGHRQRG